jgi:sigma-B regulation protein RsbU (phosphoserine phosphatase)
VRILVAEDERISRRSLQRQLESWKHDVTVAEDGVEALARFEEGDFDVVISDWDMPNMDGPALIRKIRADDRPEYVYVIMLTARTEKEDLIIGMEAGADDFLTKPFDRNELRVRLRAGERVITLERTLSSANARMKSDLDAAARVQESILPEQTPEVNAASCAWRYRPCDELAGDALNVFPLDERYLCTYVVDVSGHGVPAALLSVAVARSLWLTDDRSVILSTDGDQGFGRFARPSAVATDLNRRFPFKANGQRFFTLIYGLLDLHTGRLTFCCGGHPGPVRVQRDGTVEVKESPSFMVGVTPDPGYEDETLELSPGDRFYFFSDGVLEQMAPDGAQFGSERLIEALRAGRDETLSKSIDHVVHDLVQWAGRDGFDDDLSLLAIEWEGT